MPEEPKFVPARYIGSHVVDLTLSGRKKWQNTDGSDRTDMTLSQGDTIMMPAEEVLGKTLFANRATGQQWLLGLGRVIKAEHQDIPQDQLSALGYEFHEGRADFEPVDATPPEQPVQPEALSEGIEIDPNQIINEEAE